MVDIEKIKKEFERESVNLSYRSTQYKRYTTESIPIMYEENPNYLQSDIEEKAKPDRRLYNHFEKEIVDTKVSYFIGNPVIVQSYNGDESLDKYVDNFNISVNWEDLFAEISKDASASGVGGILFYNDNATPKCIVLNPYEFIVKYNLSEPVYAIRKFKNIDNKDVIEYYDTDYVYQFTYDDDKKEWNKTNEDIHGFGRVPIIEVINNKEKHSDYHSVCKLIDAYNRLVSDLSNEIEAFRLAYMVLENYNATKEDLAKIRETGAISTDKDGKVYFLTKQIDTKAIEVMKEILEKNISRFAGHVSFAENTFTGNLTEMAIQFKMKPLEQKTSNFERKFKVFLREFYKTLFTFKGLMVNYDYMDLTFTFTRNMPISISDEIDMVIKGGGKISNKTLLSQTSFIDNPNDEIENIKKENEETNNNETNI